MGKFIKTTDKETADTLLSLGFELFSEENGCYVFLNQNSTMNFIESPALKHCVYTNILCFE